MLELTHDELALAMDALFEMKYREKDPERRAAIGALGVKVIEELRGVNRQRYEEMNRRWGVPDDGAPPPFRSLPKMKGGV